MKLQKKNKIKSDNEYKLDLENNKYKLDSGTIEMRPHSSSITSMKFIQYAFGGGGVCKNPRGGQGMPGYHPRFFQNFLP